MKTIIQLIVAVTVLLVLPGCPEKGYDYSYSSILVNSTRDTLKVLVGAKNSNIKNFQWRNILLMPFDTLNNKNSTLLGNISIDEGMNLMQEYFNNYPLDTVQVFRHDTLKAQWVFPAFSGPCTEHSFFNYNSWRVWLVDSYEGKFMFTIYPSDLTLNKK